jgi:hypothetical protein
MLAFMGYLRIPLCLLWLYWHFASWAMSHRYCLLRQCWNTALSSFAISILCLLGCFASWAILPLGLFCLLGCFASWAALPLGLLCLLGYISTLCLLGYVSSALSSLTMPEYCYASWAVSTCCHLGYVSSTLSALTMSEYWYTSWDVPSLGTC